MKETDNVYGNIILNNINIKHIGLEHVEWIYLVQDKDNFPYYHMYYLSSFLTSHMQQNHMKLIVAELIKKLLIFH
jgi:hypothetical protein